MTSWPVSRRQNDVSAGSHAFSSRRDVVAHPSDVVILDRRQAM
jgi:hypothetical protein